MSIWSAEIKELEKLYESFKGKLPELEKEIGQLIYFDDPNVILLYSRRCLEVIITDLCECELKRERGTEPLKGIIDKLNKEKKVPSHIVSSMYGLNELSTYGTHPKDFDPHQVKPVLNNLNIIIKWYLKYKDFQITGKTVEAKSETKQQPVSPPEKSIIVLPFENISPDPDQEYFSDGLTEEIITDLSHINDMLVISRNTAMIFKGAKKKTRDIAHEVDVRYVLEGSIRKAGNRIRITAQLIDAEKDIHVWASKYDGTLDDIFDIQEKVSRSIADSIEVNFSDDHYHKRSEQTFDNPLVYEIYLKAKWDDWQFTEESIKRGEELLLKGLEIAGDHSLLYSELSHVSIQYVNNLLKDPETYPELIEKAYRYGDKAVRLNPASATAYFGKALALFQGCNFLESFKTFKKAIEVEPNHTNPMLFLLLGYLYASTGLNLRQSEIFMEKCRTIDPLTPISKTSHGWRLIYLGEFQESVNEFGEWQHVMEQIKSPMSTFFVWVHGLNNDFKEAFRIADEVILTHPNHIAASMSSFMKYSWLKEKAKAIDSVTSDLEKAAWWDDAYSLWMAEGYSVLEEYDLAFRWLNRAIDYGITNIPFLTEYDHFLTNLKNDERFEVSIQKANDILRSLKSVENSVE